MSWDRVKEWKVVKYTSDDNPLFSDDKYRVELYSLCDIQEYMEACNNGEDYLDYEIHYLSPEMDLDTAKHLVEFLKSYKWDK